MFGVSISAQGGAGLAQALGAENLDGVEAVGAAFRRLEAGGWLALPLPAAGQTGMRFEALAELAALDLSLARLVEGHCDAQAILAELGAAAEPGLYGVWAAEGPGSQLTASAVAGGYRLSGRRRYCSGASTLRRALVTAVSGQARLLLDLDLASDGIRTVAGSWRAIGMESSDSADVTFDDVFVPHASQIGAAGAYLKRPGFWHGAVGVAACWFGGALGCQRLLQVRLAQACDEHAAAHFGAVSAACETVRAILGRAAAEIDADPQDRAGRGRYRALWVRGAIVEACESVLLHTARAAGTTPCVADRSHARRIADLPVYLRQHHAERDQAELGRVALKDAKCR